MFIHLINPINHYIGSYYVHVMRNIQGIDLHNLEKKDMRNGAYSNFIPAVRSKLQLKESGPSCWKEWKRSAEIAGDRAVLKFTIPGPMTLTDGLLNFYYQDENQMQQESFKQLLIFLHVICSIIEL